MLESRPALKALGAYALFATALAVGRVAHGDGGWIGLSSGPVILLGIWWTSRSSQGSFAQFIADWLPFLSLPLFYAAIPQTALAIGPFDGAIQNADRAIFGGDVARTFAGAAPSLLLSEVLHAAYLSYYLIIYVPPVAMYWRGDRDAFQLTTVAFTWAMVLCFVAFCVMPVIGPRYLWPAPAGVPDGPVRRLAVWLLEGGSSRGTAFPSSHQAIALVMSLSSFRWSRPVGSVMLGVTVGLGMGAVYGGFHYGADMVVGAALGVGVWIWVTKTAQPRSPKPL